MKTRVNSPGCVKDPGRQGTDLHELDIFLLHSCLKNVKEGSIFGSHSHPEKQNKVNHVVETGRVMTRTENVELDLRPANSVTRMVVWQDWSN